ncbi:hypothetical protein BDW69DRAFT_168680 [Aspergillus filifer]
MQCIRSDGSKMAALIFFLFLALTLVLAQDDEDYDDIDVAELAPNFTISSPEANAEVVRDLFYVAWGGTDDYYGEITIELHPTDQTDYLDGLFTTSFPNSYTSTYLDEEYLPTLTAAETTALELWVYALDAATGFWGGFETISMYDTRPGTVTVTHTATQTPMSTSDTDEGLSTPINTAPVEDESLFENEESGLSTGAQAGIGIGAGVGGLLLLAAGFFFFRRRQKARQPQKAIREISAGENPSSSVAFINGLPSDNGSGSGAHTEAFGRGSVISVPSENGDKGFRPVSLPVVVSPIEEDRSGTGGRSGERFELGG